MISFKKGKYFIYYYEKDGKKTVKEVDGYLFEYGGMKFGCKKEGFEWNLTELKTGLKVNNFHIDKRNSIEAELDKRPLFIETIKKALNNDGNKEIMKIIQAEKDKRQTNGKKRLF